MEEVTSVCGRANLGSGQAVVQPTPVGFASSARPPPFPTVTCPCCSARHVVPVAWRNGQWFDASGRHVARAVEINCRSCGGVVDAQLPERPSLSRTQSEAQRMRRARERHERAQCTVSQRNATRELVNAVLSRVDVPCQDRVECALWAMPGRLRR